MIFSFFFLIFFNLSIISIYMKIKYVIMEILSFMLYTYVQVRIHTIILRRIVRTLDIKVAPPYLKAQAYAKPYSYCDMYLLYVIRRGTERNFQYINLNTCHCCHWFQIIRFIIGNRNVLWHWHMYIYVSASRFIRTL